MINSILCSNLSIYEKLALIVLGSYAGPEGQTSLYLKDLARMVPCSKERAIKVLLSLERKGLIKIIWREDANLYLLPALYKLEGEKLVSIWRPMLPEWISEDKRLNVEVLKNLFLKREAF